MNRLVIVLLTLVNFGLLYPGVTMDIYSVEITTRVEAVIIRNLYIGVGCREGLRAGPPPKCFVHGTP